MGNFRSDEPSEFGYRFPRKHVRTSWLFVSLVIHGAAISAAIGFGVYAAKRPVPPVAQIEIQQQIASIAVPEQVLPELEVTPEELQHSMAVADVEVQEPPEPVQPKQPVVRDAHEPTPTDLMSELTTARVLKKVPPVETEQEAKPVPPKPVPPKPAEAKADEPVTEPPQPEVASVPQEFVEAQRSDNKPPKYPRKERRLSREGEVTVRLSIDKTGSVTGVSVVEESRYSGFNRAAVRAARTWQFTPAMRGGVAVDSELDIEVVFRLSEQN